MMPLSHKCCSAALLVGGTSSRFGCDKTGFPYRGKPLYRHGLDFLCRHFADVVVCGFRADRGEPQAERGEPRYVADRHPGGGPLAGIEAALTVATYPWLFVLAADMPHPDYEVVRALWEHTRTGHPRAVIPAWSRGTEPLFALYHHDCLEPVRTLLHQGNAPVRELFNRVPTCRAELEHDLRIRSRLDRCFFNINTSSDLGGPVR